MRWRILLFLVFIATIAISQSVIAPGNCDITCSTIECPEDSCKLQDQLRDDINCVCYDDGGCYLNPYYDCSSGYREASCDDSPDIYLHQQQRCYSCFWQDYGACYDYNCDTYGYYWNSAACTQYNTECTAAACSPTSGCSAENKANGIDCNNQQGVCQNGVCITECEFADPTKNELDCYTDPYPTDSVEYTATTHYCPVSQDCRYCPSTKPVYDQATNACVIADVCTPDGARTCSELSNPAVACICEDQGGWLDWTCADCGAGQVCGGDNTCQDPAACTNPAGAVGTISCTETMNGATNSTCQNTATPTWTTPQDCPIPAGMDSQCVTTRCADTNTCGHTINQGVACTIGADQGACTAEGTCVAYQEPTFTVTWPTYAYVDTSYVITAQLAGVSSSKQLEFQPMGISFTCTEPCTKSVTDTQIDPTTITYTVSATGFPNEVQQVTFSCHPTCGSDSYCNSTCDGTCLDLDCDTCDADPTGDVCTIDGAVGECAKGTITAECVGGVWDASCDTEYQPVSENTVALCSDQKDNDCDGFTDDEDSSCCLIDCNKDSYCNNACGSGACDTDPDCLLTLCEATTTENCYPEIIDSTSPVPAQQNKYCSIKNNLCYACGAHQVLTNTGCACESNYAWNNIACEFSDGTPCIDDYGQPGLLLQDGTCQESTLLITQSASSVLPGTTITYTISLDSIGDGWSISHEGITHECVSGQTTCVTEFTKTYTTTGNFQETFSASATIEGATHTISDTTTTLSTECIEEPERDSCTVSGAQGICADGFEKYVCTNYKWVATGTCEAPQPGDFDEVCNYLDDDCDGIIDNSDDFDIYWADRDGDTYGRELDEAHKCVAGDVNGGIVTLHAPWQG